MYLFIYYFILFFNFVCGVAGGGFFKKKVYFLFCLFL